MTSDAIVPLLVVAGSAAAAAIDLRTRRVPNALTAAMAIVGLGAATMGIGRLDLAAAVAGCAVGASLMLPGYIFGATGAGDVKLLAAAGAFLGPSPTLKAFIATAIAGGVIAVVVAARRGRFAQTVGTTTRLVTGRAIAADIEDPQSDNRFAYAPAIAIGVTLAAFGW